MNTEPGPVGSTDKSDSPRPWSTVPWAPFVVPFLIYMGIGMLEPAAPPPAAQAAGNTDAQADAADFRRIYPLVYSIKIAATIAALAFFWSAYRQFPIRVSGLAIAVGVVGGILWIVLAHVPMERAFSAIGLDSLLDASQRPSFNPLDSLRDIPAWAYGFLAIRFIGLALVVPMIEELFLRAFLMRFVMHANWPQVPFGEVNRAAVAVGTIFPMLTHPPSELLAVAVWFSLVTWLMIRTKNFWDCVAAHAVTNLLLGIYVVTFKQWWLW